MSDVIKEAGNRGIRNSLEEKQVFSMRRLGAIIGHLFYSILKVCTKLLQNVLSGLEVNLALLTRLKESFLCKYVCLGLSCVLAF